MRVNEYVRCEKFPCTDVNHKAYIVPNLDLHPKDITIVMISEAAPADSGDYYYSGGNALFQETTLQAFKDAVSLASQDALSQASKSAISRLETIQDVLGLGVYFTTAVKCGKTGYGIQAGTINECSLLLEKELALFPAVKVYMLMGDVAIKALNNIARRSGEKRPIPAGSTYKIRSGEYWFQGKRVFPSYLQAGPSFYIEKSKRRVIAEDIRAALSIVNAL